MTTSARPVQQTPYGQLGLQAKDLLAVYRTMRLARAISERMWVLQRTGKTSFVVTCEGHEAAQAGSAFALRPGVDVFAPYYRDLALVLMAGMTAREVMLSAFAKPADPSSGGRQMPGHYSHVKLKIVSGGSPVGTRIPQAAGIALAAKLQKQDTVVLCSFGDGASSKGDFHEGLNFAAIHKLPVVYLCESNGYAISVPRRLQMAIERVSDRAAAYGIPGVTVDGNDPLAVYAATRQAADRARRGEGPTLIEATVYRFSPHTSNDDDTKYRSREELAEARKRDPIALFRARLLEWRILDEQADKALGDAIAQEVNEASRFAEQSPDAAPEDALRHVYYEKPPAEG